MLRDLLEDAGYETRRYSGRYMYRKSCLAIVTDDASGVVVARAFNEFIIDRLSGIDSIISNEELDLIISDADELSRIFCGTCEDQMGLQRVHYWPSVDYEKENEKNDEEEKDDEKEQEET